MSGCFADTSYYLALLSPDDDAHERAVAVSDEMRGPVISLCTRASEAS